MKHFMMLCLATICSVASLRGQQDGQQQYLFPEFQNSRVGFKDRTSTTAQINYSLVSNLFVFIDKADNDLIKELINTEEIGYILIGSRTFQIGPQGEAIEVVQSQNPIILARYTGKAIDRGQESGYGGRSQTAAIKSVSSMQTGGRVYSLKGDDRWIVSGVDKEYRVEREGKMKKFSNLNQFLKLYPKQNKVAIEKFASGNSIDFDSVEQVIELCNYAESLE
jgi:hypothetical protein